MARSPSLRQGQERSGGKAPVERRGGSSADRRERIGLGRRERRERKGVCGGRRERGVGFGDAFILGGAGG
jgi:hypothetical protein